MKTTIFIKNKSELDIIKEKIKSYNEFNKMKDDKFFDNELFNLKIDKAWWRSDWIYWKFDIQHIKELKKSKIFIDFLNWQIIEHYLIKLSDESQLQNNTKLWKFPSRKIKEEKQKWSDFFKTKIVTWNKTKENYFCLDKQWYLQTIFEQEERYYYKGVNNMIDWYLTEILFWKYLLDLKKKWKIKSFKWSNKWKLDIIKEKEIKNWEYNYELEVEFHLDSWIFYDFELTENKWKTYYIDLKWLKLWKWNDEVLNWTKYNGWNKKTAYNWKFYIKYENVMKKTNKEVIILPVWKFENQIFIYNYKEAPTNKEIRKDLPTILKNTNYVLDNLSNFNTEYNIWTKFRMVLAKTHKCEYKQDKINWDENININWVDTDIIDLDTYSWVDLTNFILFYWKRAESKNKTMYKIG